MAILEIAISCEGFPLYKRAFAEVKHGIDDEDAIASALHVLFYRIEKSIIPDAKPNTVLKLDMDRCYMHAMKTALDPTEDGVTHELSIYVIENSNIDKRLSREFMEKLLDAFIASYKDRIESMLKESIDLREFDPVLDKFMAGVLKKIKKKEPKI